MRRFGVAVKAVVHYRGRFLVVLRSELDGLDPGVYELPGGRVEFGEGLEEALTREVEEEVGLRVEPVGIVDAWCSIKDSDLQLVGITYACEASSDEVRLSLEHRSFEWVDPCEERTTSRYPLFVIDSFRKAVELLSRRNR